MVKTSPNITVEADLWRRFRNSVENASAEIERFMERRIDPEEETVEEIETRLREINDKLDKLDAERAALEQKKETVESGVEPDVWVCYDCGETGPGNPEEVERCPECHGERVGPKEQGE